MNLGGHMGDDGRSIGQDSIGTGSKGGRFFAHSGSPGDKGDWQGLPEHLRAVAELAASFASIIGLEKAAYLAGLLHDLGKYDPAFQRKLEGVQLRVDHSTAGAAILRGMGTGLDAVIVQLVMYAILGHHAGLPDMENEHGHCFKRRIDEFRSRLDPAWEAAIAPDVTALAPVALMQAIAAQRHAAFDLAVLARFLFSCLVDADYKDTEAFYARLEGREVERDWPSLQSLLPEFGARFDAYMARFDGSGPIDGLRRDILAHVRGKAGLPPGLFTLTVPTGGGKTLASLAFALDHARRHGHRRIIYAIPFTSVTDQVSKIFRDVLGDDFILEHHSAIEAEKEERRADLTTRDRMKLAMEDWAAPVIVTTNVQLFESLFAARTSRARKFHNIAGSVIVLDEAQTIPRPLLRPCVRMIDALARHFKCTIVLCTATQPALGAPRFADGFDLPPSANLRQTRMALPVASGGRGSSGWARWTMTRWSPRLPGRRRAS